MRRKKKFNGRNRKKDLLKDLFTNHSFKISLNILNREEDLPVPERSSFAYNVSDQSRKALYGFFRLMASESLKDNYVEDAGDEFGNLVNTLFKNFSLDHLDETGSLENSLFNYIRELKENIFYIPDVLAEICPDQLEPNDVGQYYCDLDTVVNILRDVLHSLRDEKIYFWESLFKRYKNDKEGLDLEFRTKALRNKKDLDNLSKITDEDIESLL
jgi:hypothetical protein